MKIAQLLSTVPDLLPQEYISELTKFNQVPHLWDGILLKEE